jgi:4a-hydroxytetrahydrobiopterin dehydratase
MNQPANTGAQPRQPRRALTATEVVAGLAKLEGWTLSGDGATLAIEKRYTFAGFDEAMGFANAVAFIAQRHDHHPELLLTYGSCTVRWRTHDVAGISHDDFDCAARVEALTG